MITKKPRSKSIRLITVLVMISVVMFGFSYALVPIYETMCLALGINGKTNPTAVQVEAAAPVDKSRTITVEFLATNNEQLPWDFYPEVKKIRIHPGEVTKISYYAKNKSKKSMTVQAIPSVAPSVASKYLKKTECFCFNRQTLDAGKEQYLPLLFHLDRDLPKDVHTVTLSYTLFDIAHISRPIERQVGRIS